MSRKISNNKLFKGIKNGNISYRRSPELIKLISLKNYIEHNQDFYRLCNSIRYSISNSLSTRNSTAWNIYKNTTRHDDSVLNYVAVIANYKLKCFQDLQAVNFIDYVAMAKKYPKFGKTLYKILKR